MILGQGVTDFKGTFGTTLGFIKNIDLELLKPQLLRLNCWNMYWCIFKWDVSINTHIRADFGLLAFNQIINLAEI